MIRVLHVIGKMDRAGAETLIMNLYRNIDRRKVQFDFLVHSNEKGDYDDEIEKLGGKIYHIERYNIKNYFRYKKLCRVFFDENHEKWDIVHGHIRSCAAIYLKEAKKNGLYTIAHSHSAGDKLLYRMLTYNIRNVADYFFGCTKKSIINAFGKKVYYGDKKKLIINGIDLNKYKYDKKVATRKRKELGLEKKYIIGHVGRLSIEKNHRFMFECFKFFVEKNKNSVLLLIGRGPLEDELKKYAKALGIEKNVVFLGIRSDVNELLMAMDVFIFPSIYEGLPVSLVEAQCSGLNCLISNNIEDFAVITNKVEKLPISSESEKLWADKMLVSDTSRLIKFNEFKEKGFDIKSTAKWIEKFYIEQSK